MTADKKGPPGESLNVVRVGDIVEIIGQLEERY